MKCLMSPLTLDELLLFQIDLNRCGFPDVAIDESVAASRYPFCSAWAFAKPLNNSFMTSKKMLSWETRYGSNIYMGLGSEQIALKRKSTRERVILLAFETEVLVYA